MGSTPDDTMPPQEPDAGHHVGDERPGDVIGPYTLVAPIGEGGFGTVWIAERREPFVQRVALKLIKAGMDSKAVIARFEQERQALAVMNHPHIAKVFDGGLTPRGRPYFAMEYVKGEPITEFCDSRKLSVTARLELFAQACDAVHHAHLKGIVHRDLTPRNVLAFDVEGESPQVKVIDFGVAKAMGQPLTANLIFTAIGEMIGTPEYMSPEQADPTVADIDTRSDVYSLGVLLYELVTGATPFDAKELRSKARREIQRIICEEDPPTPSARLSTIVTKDAELASRIERARGVAIRQLTRDLKSELEWIPLKAMRKEPQNRYQTALDFRRDVESYLAGRPVTAGPDSTAYRLRKWMRRHRVAVRSAALVVVATGIGFGYRPAIAAYQDWSEVRRMHAYDVLAQEPDPEIVTDADARARMKATGLPWKIQHRVTGIVMLLVPPGEFMMGSPEDEPHRWPDEQQHRRVIRRAFYLSQHEVSKIQWRAVAQTDAAEFWGFDEPVGKTFDDVQDSFMAHSRGFFRLPSEAEWEYACRAGTSTAYSFGTTADQIRFQQGPDPVFKCGTCSNPWGFHEMHGDVWEWVEGFYGRYPLETGTEVAASESSPYRVLRGGGAYFIFNRDVLRRIGEGHEPGSGDCCAARSAARKKGMNDDIGGFRVAMTPKP